MLTGTVSTGSTTYRRIPAEEREVADRFRPFVHPCGHNRPVATPRTCRSSTTAKAARAVWPRLIEDWSRDPRQAMLRVPHLPTRRCFAVSQPAFGGRGR